MMKAHHACSQVVFDHNLKQRRQLTGSVPSTPRNTESANVSRHTTPRDNSTSSGFGMPQMHQEDGMMNYCILYLNGEVEELRSHQSYCTVYVGY